MSSPTANKGMTYAAHAGSVNSWDTQLNQNFDQLDLNLGGVYSVQLGSSIAGATFNTSYATISSSMGSATPNSSIAQNLVYRFTGASTSNTDFTLLMPVVGSFYILDNQSTGTGAVKVNTTSGTSALNLTQGVATFVYTSTNNSNSAVSIGSGNTTTGGVTSLYTYLGTPQVTGTAGSTNGDLTSFVWDATNRQAYACVTSGTSVTAVWAQTDARPVPQGYLTLSTDASNPIISSDYTSKTAVYYTPMNGNWALFSNGTTLYPTTFSQQALSLTAGAHAANTIYDVFMYNSTAGIMIGTGPAWSNSGGGTGSRGSGAGTTQLARLNGVRVNAVQATLVNGSTSFTCPVNQGVYLGSILMDASAGQISCYRSYGQNRKWGVWNNYNRQKISIKAGDPNATFNSSKSAVDFANNSSGNSLQIFTGVAEEELITTYVQYVQRTDNSGITPVHTNAIGFNSTSAFSGLNGKFAYKNSNASDTTTGFNSMSKYVTAPSIGMQQVYALVQVTGTATFVLNGTESNMLLSGEWHG